MLRVEGTLYLYVLFSVGLSVWGFAAVRSKELLFRCIIQLQPSQVGNGDAFDFNLLN